LRGRLQRGGNPVWLAAEVRELAAGAFGLLEHGLGSYAAKPPMGAALAR
jgi:hypothetical protein